LPHRIKPLSGHQMRKEADGELSISVRDNTSVSGNCCAKTSSTSNGSE
jgi:hypothetical protein